MIISEEAMEHMEEQAEKALREFTDRLVAVVTDETYEGCTKYMRKRYGMNCILALVSKKDDGAVQPLPDVFMSPYNDDTLWALAVSNCAKSEITKTEAIENTKGQYVVKSMCGAAIVLSDAFWNDMCTEFMSERIVVSVYNDKGRRYVTASPVTDSGMDMKQFLKKANTEDENRRSFVYIKNTGMVTEEALSGI